MQLVVQRSRCQDCRNSCANICLVLNHCTIQCGCLFIRPRLLSYRNICGLTTAPSSAAAYLFVLGSCRTGISAAFTWLNYKYTDHLNSEGIKINFRSYIVNENVPLKKIFSFYDVDCFHGLFNRNTLIRIPPHNEKQK
jgi:hypothetical protein